MFLFLSLSSSSVVCSCSKLLDLGFLQLEVLQFVNLQPARIGGNEFLILIAEAFMERICSFRSACRNVLLIFILSSLLNPWFILLGSGYLIILCELHWGVNGCMHDHHCLCSHCVFVSEKIEMDSDDFDLHIQPQAAQTIDIRWYFNCWH